MRDLEPEQVENALRIVFTEADLDGNGLLSREEFQHLLQSSNLKISPQELDYMLQSVEIDEEGQIHYEEFMPTAYHLLARFQVQKNKAQKRKKRKERAKRKKQLKQEQIEEEVDVCYHCCFCFCDIYHCCFCFFYFIASKYKFLFRSQLLN